MTGESIDLTKNFQDPFLQAGTEVREGECIMLVVAVGIHSVYGKIMVSLAKPPEATPLQERLEDVATLIGKIGTVVALLLFAVRPCLTVCFVSPFIVAIDSGCAVFGFMTWLSTTRNSPTR